MSYAGRTKYDEPGRAARYRARSARRDAHEWALLEGLLAHLEPRPRDALDVPCGTGRMAERLLAQGLAVTCADLSPAMREETEGRLTGSAGLRGVLALDLEDLPLEDLHRGELPVADLVVCLRFLHHLPDAAHRRRVWTSLRALTRHHLVVSFHHPVSAHNLARGLRRLTTGRRGDRHTLTCRRVRAEAAQAGLAVRAFRPLARWRREFWLAWLEPDARQETVRPMTAE